MKVSVRWTEEAIAEGGGRDGRGLKERSNLSQIRKVSVQAVQEDHTRCNEQIRSHGHLISNPVIYSSHTELAIREHCCTCQNAVYTSGGKQSKHRRQGVAV